MKAAVIDEFGATPQYREVPDPEPGEGMQVARVRAAAIKNIERMLAAGDHYGSGGMSMPAQVGLDAVVELTDGSRVYTGATPPSGAMAEYLAVSASLSVPVPDEVDDATAAALPNAAMSAWFSLEYAGKIKEGQTVLILGATGVTGGLAVQLAKHQFRAGHVVAAGRNEARLAELAGQGADEVIQLGRDEAALAQFGGAIRQAHQRAPFDVVIDYLWGGPAEQVLGALANEDLQAQYQHTRFVQVGEMAGATVQLPAAVLRSAGLELVGQGAGSVPKEAFERVLPEIMPALLRMVADGTLKLRTRTRALAEVATAWREPAESGLRTVLVP